jgi:2-keto-3-deoxy-L-rhamnonate aldolase RhmA
MDLPQNRFKRALAARKKLVGLWSQTGSATVVELLADARPDWVLIDTEHAPVDIGGVVEQLRVLDGAGISALVRPVWNDPVVFKRVLDAGAQTLLVPYVQTPAEAAAAVAATRYPPGGTRGVAAVLRGNRYGRIPDYHARIAAEICVLVQIETQTAADNLEAIAAVDGVDGVFIGPSDLAAALGHLGNNRHADVRKTIEELCQRAQKANTPIGILATVEADARAFFDLGFTYIAVASDLGLLRSSTDDIVSRFR